MIMKKFCLPFLMAFLTVLSVDAQKVAVVDISDVLNSMPEYEQAEQELDRVAANWRQEIAKQYDEIKSMYNKYQAEQVLMSEDMKIEREEEIVEKEKTVRDLQRIKFGPEGELFRKRQELVSPIQDRVYGAIEAYADESGYDIIFDKSGSAGLIFTNDEYDKTSSIKRKLGLK